MGTRCASGFFAPLALLSLTRYMSVKSSERPFRATSAGPRSPSYDADAAGAATPAGSRRGPWSRRRLPDLLREAARPAKNHGAAHALRADLPRVRRAILRMENIPETIDGVRQALRRDRRDGDRRDDGIDRRIFPRERRVGEAGARRERATAGPPTRARTWRPDELDDVVIELLDDDIEVGGTDHGTRKQHGPIARVDVAWTWSWSWTSIARRRLPQRQPPPRGQRPQRCDNVR